MEYIQKEKEECFSLYFLCVFAAAAAPNRRHYFVKVCSTTAAPVGDFVCGISPSYSNFAWCVSSPAANPIEKK
jgi:hypothetical protein